MPLDYPAKSPYSEAFRDLNPSGLKVWLNKKLLFRNTPGSYILENSNWEKNGIECRYIIATNWKKILPEEAQHFKQQLRNVGIGKRTSFALGLAGRAFSRLHWLTGEIYILEGLDNLLTVDRARFVEGPDFDQFSQYFRQRLAYHAYRVEEVSEAGRDIERQLNKSRSAEVGPKREIISNKVEQLRDRGFEVVTKSIKDVSKSTKPVRIDLEKKIVHLVEDHPDLSNSVSVGTKKFSVIYGEWDYLQAPPIRRNMHGNLEINKKYPLFASLRFGDVFKKMLITAFILSENTNTSSELYNKLSKELPNAFKDIQ